MKLTRKKKEASTIKMDGAKKASSTRSEGLMFVRASEVVPEVVEWLWDGRVARGKINIIEGDPGLGKSTVTLDIAARLSSGKQMPMDDTVLAQANVIVCSGEDGAADSIVPRLIAAGANLDGVVILTGVKTDKGLRPITLPRDLAEIESRVRKEKAGLVILDPLASFVGGGIDTNKDSSVRVLLTSFSQMAEETGAAFIIVRHLNKGSGISAIYRGGGSIGIIGAARSALLVAKHKDDPERRVIASVKNNLAREPKALTFEVVSAGDSSRIEWGEASDTTADELVDDAPRPPRPRKSDQASTFLMDLLSSGPVAATDIKQLAEESGIAAATLERAKNDRGILSEKKAERWFWRLPAPEGNTDAQNAPETA